MGTVLLRTRDALVERRVAAAAARLGLAVEHEPDAQPAGAPSPAAIVVHLDVDDGVDAVQAWREADPRLLIVAYLSMPEPDRWTAAEKAGADLVTNRGRVDRDVERLLEDRLSGRHAARRLRLASEKDFAGRLGLAGRIDESPVGPIAIYNVGGRIHAVADACPHAGAVLSEGPLEGEVVTCPRHGSQFRVTDGERVRGPADVGLIVFKVVVEGGDAYIELPEA